MTEHVDLVALESFFDEEPLPAFDERAVAFLGALSTRLTSDRALREFPELVALGFWLRPAAVERLVMGFRARIAAKVVVAPRGLAFHVAPSNVDTIFVYSWALSFLAGNLNIVRTPSTRSPQIDALMANIDALLSDPVNAWAAARNRFVAYGHDDAINRRLVARADVRVIWGGDETIRYFRGLPGRVTAKDIVFADKHSYSIIRAHAFSRATAHERDKLAHAFVNDAYAFDQLACSSPRVVFFVGSDDECELARDAFWTAVAGELARRNHVDSQSAAMDKLSFLHECVARGLDVASAHALRHDAPSVARVAPEVARDVRQSPGQGFFFEVFLRELSDLEPLVRPNDQTVSQYGFETDDLRAFVERLRGRGIDRIVPIGAATTFAPIWDGYDLLVELTKQVWVE